MAATPALKVQAALVNGAALVVTAAAFFALLPRMPAPADLATLAERLAFGLRLTVWPALLVLLMVVGTAGARALGNAYNPIDDPETRLYRISQRVLGNTVEQTVIFVPGLLALAAVLAPAQCGALVLLVVFYVAARGLFWIGYLVHPYARAPGMAATMTVNGGMLGYVVFRVVF